jgi:hypothetical protein
VCIYASGGLFRRRYTVCVYVHTYIHVSSANGSATCVHYIMNTSVLSHTHIHRFTHQKNIHAHSYTHTYTYVPSLSSSTTSSPNSSHFVIASFSESSICVRSCVPNTITIYDVLVLCVIHTYSVILVVMKCIIQLAVKVFYSNPG